MKKILGVLLLLSLLAGCAANFYRVAPEDYRNRVKRLGVLPVLVDSGSTVLHPQKEAVLQILRESALGRETRLVDQLAGGGGYNEVKALGGDAERTAARLLAGSSLLTQKGSTYRRYQLDPTAASELATAGGVDALLVVVLNGVDGKEKRWERSGPRYLEANYNSIQATALVVAPSGEILWERPGYIGAPFLDLQYADFEEALHNRTDLVQIRFLTPDGLQRALMEADRTLLGKTDFPTLYRQLFDAIADSLRGGDGWLLKKPSAG